MYQVKPGDRQRQSAVQSQTVQSHLVAKPINTHTDTHIYTDTNTDRHRYADTHVQSHYIDGGVPISGTIKTDRPEHTDGYKPTHSSINRYSHTKTGIDTGADTLSPQGVQYYPTPTNVS